MLIRYIETKVICEDGAQKPILLKLESIREVQSTFNGESCMVNGLHVIMPYDEMKALINGDERRVTYDDNIDFRIKHLIRYNLWNVVKDDLGPRFISLLMDCADENQIYKLLERYHEVRQP